MTANEMAVLIGEFLLTEAEDVNKVLYEKTEDNNTAIIAVMENGKRFVIDVKIGNN